MSCYCVKFISHWVVSIAQELLKIQWLTVAPLPQSWHNLPYLLIDCGNGVQNQGLVPTRPSSLASKFEEFGYLFESKVLATQSLMPHCE